MFASVRLFNNSEKTKHYTYQNLGMGSKLMPKYRSLIRDNG